MFGCYTRNKVDNEMPNLTLENIANACEGTYVGDPSKKQKIITGAVTDRTFNPTDKFPKAFVERKDMEYSYQDGGLYYFMDQETYDMVPINEDKLGDAFKFVK